MRNRNNPGQNLDTNSEMAIHRCLPRPSTFISDRQLLIIPTRATTRASGGVVCFHLSR